MKDGVTVRERAAFRVLSREPDRNPLDEQRREGEAFRLAPVDASGLERLGAPFELAQELGMDGESLGYVEQFATRMFSCAASCKNRSRRALECSGPLPS